MVKVTESTCIGCGACQAMVPDVFDLNDDGIAFVMEDAKIEENLDDVKDAADNCPTGAIVVEENLDDIKDAADNCPTGAIVVEEN